MKKLPSRVCAGLLTVLLICGTAACSPEKEESSATVSEATVTPEPKPDEVVFVQPGGEFSMAHEKGIAAVNTALKGEGIALTVKKYPTEQYADKLTLLVTSGVEFDLFTLTQGTGTLKEAVDNGLISTVAPRDSLKALFTAEQWDNASVDGKIAAIPVSLSQKNGFDGLLGYRKDILQKAGYESFPTENLAEAFGAMQKAMTTEGQAATAFSWLGGADSTPEWLHRLYGSYPFSVNNFMNLVMVAEDGAVSSFYESAVFKEDAKFFRSLYNAGLISDKILTQSADVALASGDFLPSQGFTDSNATNKNLAFVRLGEAKDYVSSIGSTFTCVSKTATQPEKALQFLTWLYSAQENFDLFHYGTNGTDFTLDEKGRMVKTDDSYSMDTALTGYRPYIRYSPELSDAYIEEVKKESPDVVTAQSAGFVFDSSALLEQCRLLEVAVREHVYPIKFGIVSYDEMGAAIEALNKAGLKEYVEAYKGQYDAFLKQTAPATPENSGTGESADVAE